MGSETGSLPGKPVDLAGLVRSACVRARVCVLHMYSSSHDSWVHFSDSLAAYMSNSKLVTFCNTLF